MVLVAERLHNIDRKLLPLATDYYCASGIDIYGQEFFKTMIHFPNHERAAALHGEKNAHQHID